MGNGFNVDWIVHQGEVSNQLPSIEELAGHLTEVLDGEIIVIDDSDCPDDEALDFLVGKIEQGQVLQRDEVIILALPATLAERFEEIEEEKAATVIKIAA